MSGFDRLARPYRWIEYLTFGLALERCRLAHLPLAARARRALVLGDGDGRFTAALLRAAPQLHVVAVDSSPAMLQQLLARARRQGAADRVTPLLGDALDVLASARLPTVCPGELFDLVATHFFLDCLRTADIPILAAALRPRLAAGAHWIVSEFAEPAPWARLVVAMLYLTFRLLAGLRVRQLPAWQQALTCSGWLPVSSQHSLQGLLTSSVWQQPVNLLPG